MIGRSYCKRIAFFYALIFLNLAIGVYAKEISLTCNEEPVVVIIPSYNNEPWCRKNLDSVFSQRYDNYRVIYIDDCSTDGTCALISQIIDEYQAWDRVLLIKNKNRCGALENLYNAIHTCHDHEIIATLDGDDYLAHPDVLTRVNQEYQDPVVWLTYGQFQFAGSDQIGHCKSIPQDIFTKKGVRRLTSDVSHLRTFRAWLFKCIKKEDLLYKGTFYPVAWDKAMMGPMIEMAANGHYRFIPDVLYMYNFANPLGDARLRRGLQANLAEAIFKKPLYQPLDIPAMHDNNIDTILTGSYVCDDNNIDTILTGSYVCDDTCQ